MAGLQLTVRVSARRYELILSTLNTEKIHNGLQTFEDNICFPYGVFGTPPVIGDTREASDHILTSLGLSNIHLTPRFVTIVQRRQRIILNIDQLMTAVKSVGFPKSTHRLFRRAIGSRADGSSRDICSHDRSTRSWTSVGDVHEGRIVSGGDRMDKEIL